MEHQAMQRGRGPYYLGDGSGLRSVYEVPIRWTKPLFTVRGGAYLFNRPDPNTMEVANMQRFGERWRSPEANSLCQLLIRDQPPNHDFLILALQPELVVGECTESSQQTRGASLAIARWVSDEDRARLIKRVFMCRWPTQSGNEQQELAARRIGSIDPMTVRELQSKGLSKVFEWTKYLRELATAIGPIDDSEILVQRDRWPTTQPHVEPPRWKNWSGIKEELHYNYHPPSTQP